MDLLIFICSIGIQVSAFKYTSAQSGIEKSLHWQNDSQSHVLMTENYVGRSFYATITFEKPFVALPKLIFGVKNVHVAQGMPQGFASRIEKISTHKATIVYQAMTSNQVMSVHLSWIAIEDNEVKVVGIDIDHFDEKFKGEGDREQSYELTDFIDKKMVDMTYAHFIKGVTFLKGRFQVSSNLFLNDQQKLYLRLNTTGNTEIAFIAFRVIVGPASRLRAHFFSKPVETIKVPDAFIDPQSHYLHALTGFNSTDQKSLKINLLRSVKNDYITVHAKDREKIKEYQGILLIYKPNPKLVWDPECAEIFESCDFTGKSQLICGDYKGDDNGEYFKSIYIPQFKRVKLYNFLAQAGGAKLTILGDSQNCQQYEYNVIQLKDAKFLTAQD